MENKLNIKSFKLLNEVAFRHTAYLSKSATKVDKNGIVSIPYLKKLLEAGPADFYSELIETFASLKNEHRLTTDTCITPAIGDCFVIWGRMYVIAYFALHDDDFWRKSVLPRMIAIQPNKVLRAEMDIAREHIDQYYSENESVMKEMIAAGAPSPEDFAVFAENDNLRRQVTLQKQRIAELEDQIERLKQTKKQDDAPSAPLAGRPKQVLFSDKSMELEQKERVLAFLKKHNLSSQHINCEKDNKLNKYIASIYWRWQQIGIVPEEALPTAYYVFLADICQLKFDVMKISFANRMGEILKHKEIYPDIHGEVAEFFQK